MNCDRGAQESEGCLRKSFSSRPWFLTRRVQEVFDVEVVKYKSRKEPGTENLHDFWQTEVEEMVRDAGGPGIDQSPELSLAAGILVHALEDLVIWHQVKNGTLDYNSVRYLYTHQIAKERFDEVIGWFMSDHDEHQPYPFSVCTDITSFKGICGLLGLNSDAVLSRVFRVLRNKGLIDAVA